MKGTHKQIMARKETVVSELEEKIAKATIIIFTNYRGELKGLTVKEIRELRKKFRECKAEYKIAKNTLISRVLKEKGILGFDEYLHDPTALVIGYDDPVGTAKVLANFAKEKKSALQPEGLPLIKGAYLEGQKMDSQGAKNVATLASKPEILSSLLSLMIAPTQRIMGVLNGPATNMVNLLENWNHERQEGTAEATAEATAEGTAEVAAV